MVEPACLQLSDILLQHCISLKNALKPWACVDFSNGSLMCWFFLLWFFSNNPRGCKQDLVVQRSAEIIFFFTKKSCSGKLRPLMKKLLKTGSPMTWMKPSAASRQCLTCLTLRLSMWSSQTGSLKMIQPGPPRRHLCGILIFVHMHQPTFEQHCAQVVQPPLATCVR